MKNLENKSEEMQKAGQKILNILSKLDEPTAMAVINYCFVVMIVDDDRGPVVAKAMAATFLNNAINSINNYFNEDEEEFIH